MQWFRLFRLPFNACVRSQDRQLGIVVDEGTMVQIFLRLLQFSPASIIPLKLKYFYYAPYKSQQTDSVTKYKLNKSILYTFRIPGKVFK